MTNAKPTAKQKKIAALRAKADAANAKYKADYAAGLFAPLPEYRGPSVITAEDHAAAARGKYEEGEREIAALMETGLTREAAVAESVRRVNASYVPRGPLTLAEKAALARAEAGLTPEQRAERRASDAEDDWTFNAPRAVEREYGRKG